MGKAFLMKKLVFRISIIKVAPSHSV